MDHGLTGPQGALGGGDGAVNRVEILRADGRVEVPPHLSKAQDIAMAPGDRVRVRTPGGGGYGRPEERDPEAVREDLRLGRYDEPTARRLWPHAFALADDEKDNNSVQNNDGTGS